MQESNYVSNVLCHARHACQSEGPHSELDWQGWRRVCFEDHHAHELWSAQTALKEPTAKRPKRKHMWYNGAKWLVENDRFWKILARMFSHHFCHGPEKNLCLVAWDTLTHYQKHGEEKDEQHAKALEACLNRA